MTPTSRRQSITSVSWRWLTLSLVGVISLALSALWWATTEDHVLTPISVLLFVVVGFVGGLLCIRLYTDMLKKNLIEPIDHIITTTHAIADGAVSGRISLGPSSVLDVVRVADAINRLARRAAKDIGEMKRLERVRSEFVANVSHELRTPIFSVQGYLETLLDGAMDDPNVSKQFLEKAYNNALRLNALLSDLIDISRIESGELKFSFRYFDLGELLLELVHSMEIRAEQRNVTVHCECIDASSVFGDKERLSQVVTNLLENAVKYNVDGGHVYVRAERVRDSVHVTVRDTGLGIADEHLSRIFERFYRVDKDRSRAVGGTGLGLAIVKHILEAHHAPIAVQSTVGQGTEISFVLRAGA